MNQPLEIDVETLRNWLDREKKVTVIDIRPLEEIAEWSIPGSIHIDAYHRLKENDTSVFNDSNLNKSIPLVTVCAGGKTSKVAAEILSQKGFEAYSLRDGMKGWSLAWNTAHKRFNGFEVWQIRRTGKGCLSYIIASNREAIIIDASLSLDVYSELVKQNGLSIKFVVETHTHADHLSRAKPLADYFEAPLYLPGLSKAKFSFKPIDANCTFNIGKVIIGSIPTPGHTLDSFSFYIKNSVLLTGDTLFTNGVGRPDLKATLEETSEKAKLLYQSLKKMISLPDHIMVLPAHTNMPAEFDHRLIGITIREAKNNIRILQMNEEEFITSILQKIPLTPPNFFSIIERNIAGDFSDINPVDLEAGANRCAIM